MLYTPMTKRALRLCLSAHKGQVDRAGLPYALHPIHVAEQMSCETETCAALLHDTMEDCNLTREDLLAAGMDERVVRAVELLTHRSGVPYLTYVKATLASEAARNVKVADLRHNSDLGRLDTVTRRDLERLSKYQQARVVLGDMAYELQTPRGMLRVWADEAPLPLFAEPELTAEGPCTRVVVELATLGVGTLVTLDAPPATVLPCDDADRAYRCKDLATGTYEIIDDPLLHLACPQGHILNFYVNR